MNPIEFHIYNYAKVCKGALQVESTEKLSELLYVKYPFIPLCSLTEIATLVMEPLKVKVEYRYQIPSRLGDIK